MPKYRVHFYMDVTAVCEVEADNPKQAHEIAQFEPWDYEDEDVYSHEVFEIDDNHCNIIPARPYEVHSIFNPPDIEGVEVRRLK